MQTLKIELTDKNSMKALHELENKNLIRIVSEPETNYLSLPGDPVSQEEFRQWVNAAEKTSTVSLTEAKQKLHL
jgi:hypothetical protein